VKSIVLAKFVLIWVIDLNPELKIWIPLFIINDWDLNFLLTLSFAKVQFNIDVLVILGCNGSIINGPDTNSQLLINDLLNHSHFNMPITLSDRVVEALETNKVILFFDVLSSLFVVVKLAFGSFHFYEVVGAGSVSLSIGESFQKLVRFECICKLNVRDLL